MTNKTEIILDKIVEKDLPQVRQILSQHTTAQNSSGNVIRALQAKQYGVANGQNVYGLIIEKLSQGTRNNAEQISYLDAYENALSVFRTAALELRTEMDVLTLEQRLGAQEATLKQLREERKGDTKKAEGEQEKELDSLQRQVSDAVFFSNRYALFMAGQVGLASLGAKEADTKKQFTFGTQYDASKDKDELTRRMNEVVKQDFSEIADELTGKGMSLSDENLKHTLEAVFTTWVRQFNWDSFKDVAESRGVTGLSLKFQNYSAKDGKFSQKHSLVDVDSRFMILKKEDVIGNREFGSLLWNNMIKLSAYDHDRRTNPHDPASVIFVYGGPGCGKTFTAHAYVRSFAELCKAKGLPLLALTHSVTDYASHYQNLTANQLAALAGKINDFPGPVLLYVADADTIFSASRKGNLTSEQTNTLGVYFKMFDGTLIPKNGKFMAIMDANYIDTIDDATKSRLFDEIYELRRFDSAKDFADMARVSLQKRADKLSLKDKDWLAVGDYIFGSPLSNREVDHVLKKIRRSFSVPEELVGATYEEHAKYRASQLKGISSDRIIATFGEYVTTRAEIEEKSRASKLEDDAARFLKAIGTFGNPTEEGLKQA